MVNLLSKIVY